MTAMFKLWHLPLLFGTGLVAGFVDSIAGGGGLIYYSAEPFLGSLLAVSAILGVPSFVFVQWVAPFVSEFPEKVSAFYWARTVDRASAYKFITDPPSVGGVAVRICSLKTMSTMPSRSSSA